MTKRELIEKNKVKKLLDEGWDRGVYPRNDIMCLPTLTEQEIVKPYLEKLKKQIVGKSSTEELFDEDAFNSMYSESVSKDTAECESYIEMTIVKMDDVLRLIDNLLSEQELKNEL
jgi:hypothetical protein